MGRQSPPAPSSTKPAIRSGIGRFKLWLDTWLPQRCVAWDGPLSPSDAAFFCPGALDSVEVANPALDPATGSFASFRFGGALRDAVVAAKYLPDERRARRLAEFWTEHLHRHPFAEEFEQIEAVVFVPAHWRRRLWRGFDFSPLLAEAAGRVLNRPVIDALRCIRHERALSGASSREERSRRAADRYQLRVAASALPSCLLLVDDVITTGATLNAASAPLRSAQRTVLTAALARTPDEPLASA